MSRIDPLLRRCLQLTPEGRGSLTLPRQFQGFPDTAHGGSILAALDLVADRWLERATPRLIAARIQRGVPLDAPLALSAFPSASAVALTLEHDGRLVVNGTVAPAQPSHRQPPDDCGDVAGAAGSELPTSRGCLACGAENPWGLQVRLRFDDRRVWTEHRPREVYRSPDGSLAPALFTVLLDEIAWWLVALASGEAGVTTDIRVTLERPDDLSGDALLAVGRRDRVEATDRKGHFWKTEAGVFTAEGGRLASAEVTFAASRAYSRTLMPALLATNSRESVRRVFPKYVA